MKQVLSHLEDNRRCLLIAAATLALLVMVNLSPGLIITVVNLALILGLSASVISILIDAIDQCKDGGSVDFHKLFSHPQPKVNEDGDDGNMSVEGSDTTA